MTGNLAPATALEVRYRRLLRILPRPYRAAREQEMVDTFLARRLGEDPDNADLTAKFGGVGFGEAMSVLALALRLRWADPVGPARYRLRVGALRIALFAFLVMACVDAVGSLGARLYLTWWPAALLGDAAPAVAVGPPPSGIVFVLRDFSFVLWFAVTALALAGGRARLWWATALAAIPTAVTVISAVAYPDTDLRGIVAVLVAVAVLAALPAAAISGTSLRLVPHHRGWIVVAAALGLTMVLAQGLAWYGVASGRDLRDVLSPVGLLVVDQDGTWCLAVVIVTAVLVVRRIRRTVVPTESVLGLAYFSGALTLMRGAGILDWYGVGSGAGAELPVAVTVAVLIQFAVVAAIAVTAGTLAARRIRHLPRIAYPPASG